MGHSPTRCSAARSMPRACNAMTGEAVGNICRLIWQILYICLFLHLQLNVHTMSQVLTNILLHIVFHKKTASPVVRSEDQKRLNLFVMETCRRLECHPLIVNGPGDHLHLLFDMPPTVSLSAMLKELKRTSSLFLKECDTEYYHSFYWQAGYGAFSVSYKLKDAVYKYIENQQEHHRRCRVDDEFEMLIRNAWVENYKREYYWE